MTLVDVTSKLPESDRELTIHAAEPRTSTSSAIIEAKPDVGGLSENARIQGLSYSMEDFIASDFLERWMEAFSTAPSEEECCLRLIQSATNDAWSPPP